MKSGILSLRQGKSNLFKQSDAPKNERLWIAKNGVIDFWVLGLKIMFIK